jgi:myo-inositol-1-phosphate synthase
MNTQAIDELIQIITERGRKLDKKSLTEVLGFVDFLVAKNERENLNRGISRLAEKTKAIDFLVCEPDVYSTKDVQ